MFVGVCFVNFDLIVNILLFEYEVKFKGDELLDLWWGNWCENGSFEVNFYLK